MGSSERQLLVVALLAGCASAATSPPRTATVAPASDSRIFIGERLGLRSEILGEDRVVMLYRPPALKPGVPCPVIYVLDAEAHFIHAAGLIQFLAVQQRMPQMMVVGVGNTDRTRDFTPTPVARVGNSGGADRFLAFLEKELMPAAEEGLGATPYRILIGHSYGGLLAIHALSTRPDLFDAIVSISPSLYWADNLMAKETRSLFAARPVLDKAVYVAIGTEPPDITTSNRAYAAFIQAGAPQGLRWRYEEMEHEDHGSIVHRGIYRGLEHVFEGWQPLATVNTLEALEVHHQGLAARFRLPHKVPELQLNLLAYRMLAAGRLDEAIAAFRRNVELHPESANVYDSLAEALEKKGDHAEAMRNYEMAVKTAAVNRDPRLQDFMANRDRARHQAQPAE